MRSIQPLSSLLLCSLLLSVVGPCRADAPAPATTEDPVESATADTAASTPAPAPAPDENAVQAITTDGTGSDAEHPVSGDISLAFTRNRSTYTSYQLSTSLDLTYKLPNREVLTEARIDREDVRVPGSQDTSVSTDEYDVSVKLKSFRPDSATYLYASPRLRYNRFSFYRNTQAMRLGIGRRIYGSEQITLDMEIGSGYRWAQPVTGPTVKQTLYTVTSRFSYYFSKSLSMKINYSSEKAGLERYNNLVASLNTPLVGALGLKYEMSYRKIFPFDSGQLSTETSYNLALNYQI